VSPSPGVPDEFLTALSANLGRVKVAGRLALTLLLVALGYCGGCRNKETEASTPAPAAPVPTSAACASLTRLQCYASTHCFLEHRGSFRYACRDKRGPCEVGLRQTDQAACEKRPQCEWRPGECFCPFPGYGETAVKDPDSPAAACACGGGPPARCVERGSKPEGDATPR